MRRLIPAALAALLLWGVAGCGSNPTGPGSGALNQQNADDLAIQAVTGLVVLGGEVQVMLGSTPAAPQARARRAAPARAMWDTTVTANGITYEASRTFYDALDNELPSYGPLAVRMRWTGRAHGSHEGPRDTASVGHATVLDVRGIQATQDTVRLDGTCNDTLQISFRSLDGLRHRWFYWTSSVTVDAVRILKSTFDTAGWPIGGTVTYVVSADRLRSNSRVDVDAHFDATVVVVFNGTSQPVVVVNGSYYYHWNMQTGAITRA
jgi:hypothetical protein